MNIHDVVIMISFITDLELMQLQVVHSTSLVSLGGESGSRFSCHETVSVNNIFVVKAYLEIL
jgi:hypothetical protein